MSEYDGTQASTKRGKSRQTGEKNGAQTTVPQRPASDDKEVWKAYWKQQEQPWRTEPEIDAERQRTLSDCRAITPDIEKSIYPFKDVEQKLEKLTRADIEWLLATHENGRGPVDWSVAGQKEREGLDLRGADLQGIDLSDLPLSCLRGGLTSLYKKAFAG